MPVKVDSSELTAAPEKRAQPELLAHSDTSVSYECSRECRWELFRVPTRKERTVRKPEWYGVGT